MEYKKACWQALEIVINNFCENKNLIVMIMIYVVGNQVPV